ncbi:hypothetical protein BJ546DRAFT_348909 [Cryomyces antarcticus]|uniref:Acetyltransferase n=1 Tax=Cryomyces antarcticus TaxID=329879 RepID=A0ABR0M1L1_9PEZI|nr:hypothetical protein LTR16_000421 [Cryomyces antarcticus]
MAASHSSAGRYILTSVALFTAIGPFLADFNTTHVYNPSWPAHAKFHNGQTMSMGVFLGLSTLYYTWRTPATPDSLFTATMLATAYYITQLSSWFYPGAKPGPEASPEDFPQLWLSLGIFALSAGAYALERKRIRGMKME